MLQVNLSFRRLLMRYTPLLNEQVLKEIESRVALRQQLKEEVRLSDDATKRASINKLTQDIQDLSVDFGNQIRNLIRLYSARRLFALRQGHLQQIPQSFGALLNFIGAAVNLFIVEITIMPLIWWESLRMSLSDLWEYVLAGMLVFIPIYLIIINDPPQITSTAVTGGSVGLIYNYQVTAIDPEGDSLKFKLIQAPAFLSIDSIGGMISGVPTISDTFAVKILVEDYKGAWDDQIYSLFVNP